MSISRYRDLLSTPAVGALLASSVLARAFTGMTSLAMLLLVTQDHGYDVAGLVTGTSVVGSVLTGPAVARLADRVGRRLVLLVCSVTYTGSLVTLALLPSEPLLLMAVASVGGATTPPVMAALRAAIAALTSPEQRLTAFSLDSTLQEIVLVVGPMVTTMLVAFAGPQAALIGSGVLTLLGTVLYCGQRAAEAGRPARAPHRRRGARHEPQSDSAPPPRKGRLAGPGFVMMMGSASALLAGLVMVNLAAVAGAGGPDAPTASALMLACVAAGSGIGGLVFGARAKGRAALALFPGGVAVGAVLLALAPNTVVLAILLVLFGTMVAPALTMLYDGLTRRASATRATEAFAWLSSATGVGGAIGNMAGGTVVEHLGSRGGFLVAAASLAICAGICSLPVLRRPAIRPEPENQPVVAGAPQPP
ncbi:MULTISPECIES: MFS transporter [Actinoalloteichus]|uniref:Arabinose efflux permease family protein n=1 Tax=Actinoalloteichus fjordicus TaxID=1612552 RepID=A0AAC9PS23_9PSEU|nr:MULTISPECIES: MFS transporter [Actinoalloteichus]APU14708.1 arabinose efflux permease family protein [Actinoalloteichus fjordicus]APU20676.1 arabinose efflux permease family protein [Actinoalloteichus sp. GBA129-24]